MGVSLVTAAILWQIAPQTERLCQRPFASMPDAVQQHTGALSQSVPLLHDVTLLSLAWREKLSLENALASWSQGGLLDAVNESILFVQQLSHDNFTLRARFGIDVIGSERNIGIGKALCSLVEQARTPLVMFLEKDWVLRSSPSWSQLLPAARDMVANRTVDLVRLRPANDCNAAKLSQHAGRAAAQCHPEQPIFCGHSSDCHWSNNPILFHRQWFVDHIRPIAAADPGKNWVSTESGGETRAIWFVY